MIDTITAFFVDLWQIYSSFDLFITLFAIVLTSSIIRWLYRLGANW